MINRQKLFHDFDKEERWLASMAGQGYEFVSKNCLGVYRFRNSKPKDTVIRIDYRNFKHEADFADYKVLFEDSGWKHIAGSKNSGAQYFKRLSNSADDDIFSDQASKAGRYRRLSHMYFSLAAVFLPLLAGLLASGAINIQAFLNPKLLYQTPGLWEKTAADFWRAFLFETPFAVLRGLAFLAFPAMVAFSLFYAIRADIIYKKSASD
ncbi:MAG: DUF2812 domain-containing protein [Dethiobacteria bacterium]